jgi:hypothetical protein
VSFLGLRFCFAKPQGIETAGIRAGLKHPHPCGCSPSEFARSANSQGLDTAGIHAGHPAIFGLGVLLRKTPRNRNSRPPCRHEVTASGWSLG